MIWKTLTRFVRWQRPHQPQPPGLRIALELTPAQIVAIHSLLSATRRRARNDGSVLPRAVEAARGVLTAEQRLKLDQLAATAKNHPVVEEAARYNLLSTAH